MVTSSGTMIVERTQRFVTVCCPRIQPLMDYDSIQFEWPCVVCKPHSSNE
jgi:hypothetical protein